MNNGYDIALTPDKPEDTAQPQTKYVMTDARLRPEIHSTTASRRQATTAPRGTQQGVGGAGHGTNRHSSGGAGSMNDIAASALAVSAANEFRRGWPVVAACFCTAVFAWGFGFYGQAVYLAELQRLHGWSAGLVSSATTCFYLAGAVGMTLVHRVIDKLGPRTVLAGGAVSLGAGAMLLSQVTA